MSGKALFSIHIAVRVIKSVFYSVITRLSGNVSSLRLSKFPAFCPVNRNASTFWWWDLVLVHTFKCSMNNGTLVFGWFLTDAPPSPALLREIHKQRSTQPADQTCFYKDRYYCVFSKVVVKFCEILRSLTYSSVK